MIDCVFLLLLYFIAASKIKPEEKYLGLMMPGNTITNKAPLIVEIRLAITENGQVTFNEQPMDGLTGRDLPTVRAKLRECIDLFGDKQPVVIHPQPMVRQQRIVDVLNACAAAQVKNLSFMANTH